MSLNLFPADPDRGQIWEMLVPRDIAAFIAADWSMVADDFITDGFCGLHAHGSRDPDDWTLSFPTLAAYRDEWLRQAAETAATAFAEDPAAAIHRATDLSRIDIEADMAIAHKKFDGTIRLASGREDRLNWQTLYQCRRVGGRWRIAGFTGYMAHR
ncbi:hypothetical protein OU426_04435 [Frigidibacter sp. RF13]|uniref:hypothetical protein n=1 Tax=Frigidibacter sp. RF13 TaxID=2997340 RepID=UPI0022708E2D|nr:hypothetical protein [Frigidibacter sp. RF13]MCY1126093.1 hypothetical protein [Frigidibacter sp. RF13]